ncbi:M1 family metallopeptidase [candidate division KSB1 bacterium]|nr:M1 family metallopeptidase [candidate division KSB1 bacterium]
MPYDHAIGKLRRFGLVACFCAGAFAQPVIFQQPLSPRIANYDIDVKLDAEKKMLHGNETLKWFNKSGGTITELQFHLYLNAFRNHKSTFMKESGGVSRGNKIDKDGWGFIEANKIALASGEDLTGSMEFIQPDDGNPDDKTVFRLPLPQPLKPNDSIIVHIDFTGKLPQPPFARTGAKKEYFFVGQWFPKIGVYIDGKWNCHQFHANSEFFADYGVYNVRMTVPEKNILGATGLQVEVKNNGDGTATHFYHAEDVHDFAWTTSPEFVEFKDKTQDVDIRVLMQPDHAYQGPRHVEAAKAAVEYFQNWYGDYPFPNLTVVDPRRGAGGSGGMEYPTLITAGTAYGLPEGIRGVELVIIHEFGHNFWYHLLASNEFEESWMDEGINTYTEIQIVNDKYGPVGDMINWLGIKINGLQLHRGQYIFYSDLDPILRNAWGFYSGTSYGVNSYAKPGVVLTTLQNYLGKEKVQQVMRTYVERWRFKHPKSRDFFNVVDEVAGEDLAWFFDQAFFSNAVLDYSVDRVFTREIKKAEGYDFTLSVAKPDSGMTNGKSQSNDSVDANAKSKMYESGVNVRRLGTFKFPVEMVATFDNGEKVREKWDGQELWKKFTYLKPSKLVSATVDPDFKIPLDLNYTNNSKAVKGSSLGVNKLSVRWLFWLQFLLDQPEFMNLLSAVNSIF